MFNGKSKSEFAAETGGNSTNLIGNGTTLKGDITCNGDLRIDGTLIGNINSTARVVIGANGLVEGDIHCQQADVMGKIVGTIKIKELLQLKASAVVNGNIYAGKLQIEPAATFNGACHMGSEPATVINEKQKDKAA